MRYETMWFHTRFTTVISRKTDTGSGSWSMLAVGDNMVQTEVQRQEVCPTVLSEADSVYSGDLFPSCTEALRLYVNGQEMENDCALEYTP